ncbi:hypothetical protein RclHR1_28520001 [Rhizophagus clarus]|uniref:Uncharacterized protein n=1 Tax=Rhizophagus clarus TaxID=94130 RepID=A0A2Z6RJD9_9GLOM|nr:hypothetical protein RclHR1_28520001 [Rhizophagus clarus]GET00166.1 hypothetical protein GLOIN_2v1772394 [Rhizophagus clarus]
MCLYNKIVKPGKINQTDKHLFKKKNINTIATNLNEAKLSEAKSSDVKSSETDLSETNLNNANSSKTDLNNSNNDDISNKNSIDITKLNKDKKFEVDQVIFFNLIIKPSTSFTLPSKWLEIKILLIDDILILFIIML